MKNVFKTQTAWTASAFILMNLTMIGNASAHCDGLDGPVIIEARSALEKKDVTPLLKWVPEASEHTIKASFATTLQERTNGKAAQEVADRKLFETLVRVHRESEGAPFTGVKPAGQIAPVVVEADAALAKTHVDRRAKHVAAQVEKSVREKFEKAAHSKEFSEQSVEKGREYVSNYVQYVHYVEELNNISIQKPENHAVDAKTSGHAH